MEGSNASDEDYQVHQDMFKEPTNFYAEKKGHTYDTHTLESGRQLKLRLVGQNPLWGHMLWNAGCTIANYFEKDPSIVQGKYILEFGAGGALPSLVCAQNGAAMVVATDYPDTELIENITFNIHNSSREVDQSRIIAEGFLWGSSTDRLKRHLPEADSSGFHVLILADVVFNHSEHARLIQSILDTLRYDGSAFVWFSPYRPWLLKKDLAFFSLAEISGLVVEKLFEQVLEKPLFLDDPGDETLRKTVFAYRLSRIRNPDTSVSDQLVQM